jgi:UDP-N-acetylglucosamine diphosphorylase/glucosamine-1-phosphate N-acetyltransferase
MRHAADIRIGICTIREKWERITGLPVIASADEIVGSTVVIPAQIIPCASSAFEIIQAAANNNSVSEGETVKILHHPWQIFQYNDWALRHDYDSITKYRESQPISATNHCINPQQIFLEQGASVECCILNASLGPIYIGKNAQIMEGSMIRGPFSAGDSATVKMGARIYGATTVGPHCVVGGEIKNAVLFGYSNKAHDGYLGDSVLGEWCNIGAGTSNSNVKNTGGEVRYVTGNDTQPVSAGNKAGLLMGDFSRCAINTSFNTGTIIGVCCNIFGESPSKFVNDFSWGKETYIFEKVLSDIRNWKKMKGQELSERETSLLKGLYYKKG